MSYDSFRQRFDKEHIWIVEIDLWYCQLTHGTSPCTATETGDAKCFNTFGTCNDTANYDDNDATPSVKTYRFCSSRSPQPIGLDAIPSLESVSVSPGTIDISGGLGVRSSVSLTFKDHPSSDIGFDDYLTDRTYIAFERGSFWTKLRARNANYENRVIRVYSGYLEDDGSYDLTNFEKREYILDKMDVTNGKAKVTGKDPLKLAMEKKAQVPVPNTGELSGNLTVTTDTTFSVGTGEGAEYTTGSNFYVVIDKEIMEVTRSGDTFTHATNGRGKFNTVAATHDSGAKVQECYEQSSVNVDVIVNDLLTNYANVPTGYIDTTAWANETADYLDENMNGIIPKPTDVYKELKLLAKSAPHYLWWDDVNQKIQFTALQEPPATANVIDEGIIIEDSFKTKDRNDMRRSRVFVNYGIFDPTEKLDETRNYELTYVRTDADSTVKYDSDQVEAINTRWIGTTGKNAAVKIATLIGRRFANAPREIMFNLDPSYRIGLGAKRLINHRDIVDGTGAPVDTLFQIISENERGNVFEYKALEFAYGQELTGDSVTGITQVFISLDELNVNLASKYTTQIGTITGDITVKFIVDTNVVVGSSSNSTPAMTMGDWSGATTTDITLEVRSGAYVVGYGGDGGDGDSTLLTAGESGGNALTMTENLTLVGTGTIGGGGGGGGADQNTGFGSTGYAGGGGGAGSNQTSPQRGGQAGINTFVGTDLINNILPQNGSKSAGGNAGVVQWNSSEPTEAIGGSGGDLGQAGGTVDTAGGAPGSAIEKAGNTLTKTGFTGTISGAENA